MRLDAKTVAGLTLPAGKSDHFHWDEELTGFGLRLRIGSDGQAQRSWVVQYRIKGRSRRIRLGSANVLTPDEARKAARKTLAKATLGEDPAADRDAQRQEGTRTLRAVIDVYLDDVRPGLRPNSFRSVELYLKGPAYFGPLHGTPIADVALADVAARVGAIKRASGATTAARARGTLSAVYTWAAGEGLLGAHPINPVAFTNKPAVNAPRDRVLSDDELAAVWHAAGEHDDGRVLKLLILTAARRHEVGGMRWSELDLERGVWTLPKERTKNGRSHALPLSSMALSIIQSVPCRIGRDCLFGERSDRGFTAFDRCKAELDAQLGDKVAPFRFHDLRRSGATRMCDLGVAPHVVEQILDHVSGHRRGIGAIYNRSKYQNEVRAALLLWDDHIRAITKSSERKVITFARH